MADTGDTLTRDDLRAAVAAGTVTEAQAASLLATAQARAGFRQAEDEPFELFKGFAEIFVAVGMSILIAGMVGIAMLMDGSGLILVAYGALAWWAATYYTLKRRMMLPSITLVSAYAGAAVWASTWALAAIWEDGLRDSTGLALVLLGTAVLLVLWYRRFRLPFTVFLIGLCGFGIAITLTANLDTAELAANGLSRVFDLRSGSALPIGTLLFGFAALAGGLWFDMKDPYRLGRNAASAFWLHILAAPALVNTVALTFYNMGPGPGFVLLAISLVLISALALIIDRRSFLTAGIGYLIFLISYTLADPDSPSSWALVLFVVGLGLTSLGTFWTDLRLRLMRALPDFPGKNRLPPYQELT
ncbi:MAG: hypothetical protein P8O10_08245 [Pseudorhodobacter sp.]|nr:hypothetical protein [Pseudorhodobacter sp.]